MKELVLLEMKHLLYNRIALYFIAMLTTALILSMSIASNASKRYHHKLADKMISQVSRSIQIGDLRSTILDIENSMGDDFISIKFLEGKERHVAFEISSLKDVRDFRLSSLPQYFDRSISIELEGFASKNYNSISFIYNDFELSLYVVFFWSIFAVIAALPTVYVNTYLKSRHNIDLENERNRYFVRTTQTIAHDLKGPLAVFQKIAFGSQRDYEHEKENLIKALNRLTSMADSIKRADLESQVNPYNCTMDLDETISSALSYAEKYSISLQFSGETLDGIQIDLAKVERAVSNLLFNAIEAANSYVEISWLILKSQLSILVKDDGDGVPEELIPKLFTRGATYGKENGTGLGLAFVDHVARGHGGKVEYIRKGKISMFKLVLEDVKIADDRPEPINVLDQKEGKFLINQEPSLLILIKLKDGLEEQTLSKNLAKKLSVAISNDFDDLPHCHIFFTDDSSLLLRDYPKNVRVIMNRPEKAETVLRGLLEVKA